MITKRNLSEVIAEPATIIGFNGINEVAQCISSLGHGILFDGYLVYAVKCDGPVKSVVMTTGETWGKLRLSINYDSYKMLFNGLEYDKMDGLLLEFADDKKLKIILDSLMKRFYEDKV